MLRQRLTPPKYDREYFEDDHGPMMELGPFTNHFGKKSGIFQRGSLNPVLGICFTSLEQPYLLEIKNPQLSWVM